jgi:deoxyribodipyrimidine photolyase-related protein
MSTRNLILVLGDQLSPELASLKAGDPEKDRIMMAEVMAEATYLPHHKKKIAFVFSAMRHFAEELSEAGWRVEYRDLDAPGDSLKSAVEKCIGKFRPEKIVVTEPGEWRLIEEMRDWSDGIGLPVEILEDDRFICSHKEFEDWAEGRKQFRMEYFYREMRKKTGLLMDGDEPEGGQWNYDAENRKPPKQGLDCPKPPRFVPDKITNDVFDLVDDRFANHFGDLKPFRFGVTRDEALRVLDRFIEEALPSFGDFQDAMMTGEKFLFHSLLSFYINAGLLDPLDVCRRVEKAYRDGDAPLNAAEGFIRQIIGWREYVRGIYFKFMPGYTEKNYFGAERKLPDFYWTGDTKMACVSAAVTQTKEEAYAHHIQRLMITGNFALVAGIEPHEVHEWYLAVYADAYEWVEAPNTIGMSQFADGGLLASKPYASSGNYINKMSNYCSDCHYSVSRKTGEGACPFNALYWDFLARHEKKLSGNPRMAQMYATWNRMKEETRQEYLDSAKAIFKRMEEGTL